MKKEELDKKYTGFLLIHAGLFIATILYAFFLFYIKNYADFEKQAIDENILKIIFYGAIVYLTLCMFLVAMFKKRWINSYKPFDPPKYNQNGEKITFASLYISRHFVSFAFFEIGAVAGIIIFFLGGDIVYSYICIGFSAFILLLNTPNKKELETLRQKEFGDELTNQGFKIT